MSDSFYITSFGGKKSKDAHTALLGSPPTSILPNSVSITFLLYWHRSEKWQASESCRAPSLNWNKMLLLYLQGLRSLEKRSLYPQTLVKLMPVLTSLA